MTSPIRYCRYVFLCRVNAFLLHEDDNVGGDQQFGP